MLSFFLGFVCLFACASCDEPSATPTAEPTYAPTVTTYLYVDDDADCGRANASCNGSMAKPFETIQQGLDAADDSTLLYLFDGTYTGQGNTNLEIYDKYRRLSSWNGSSNCTIDCQGAADTFGIAFNKGSFLLDGISIVNCSGILRELVNLTLGDGFAVPSVENVSIGGALWIENAYARVSNCRLDGNSAGYGGAIYGYSSSIEVDGCVITGNEARLGGGVYIDNGYILLNDSTAVVDNRATHGGGGVYISNGVAELDYGSYLYNNEADDNDGNEVLCVSGAGTLLNSAYISALDLDESDFQEGDAVCRDDCALTQEETGAYYCDWEFDSSSSSASSGDAGSSDDNGGNGVVSQGRRQAGAACVLLTNALIAGLIAGKQFV